MADEKKKRGGNVKRAPEGYYTASEAAKRLGLNINTFRYYVQHGKIKRYVPPLRSDGYYSKKEINQLATETALFFHTLEDEAIQGTVTRVALPEDVQGIYNVLDSFGWQTAPVELRIEWYKVNPAIDYAVLSDRVVMGYITAPPYTPNALEGIMSGKKRAWHMTPEDILPYQSGRRYNLYIGIAVRQDIPNHTRIAFRLIAGFIDFLEELAVQGVIITAMYAISDQEDGQRLCRALGFVEQAKKDGDKYPRFMLDLAVSDSQFARRYREMIKK